MEQSLWAQYVRELRGDAAPQFIEYPWGFISFTQPRPETIYIEDIYVVPKERGGDLMYKLIGEAEATGHKLGASEVVCSVRVDSPSASRNLRIYLTMGAAPTSAHDGRIYLARKIKVGG